jgi:hypothetical protein
MRTITLNFGLRGTVYLTGKGQNWSLKSTLKVEHPRDFEEMHNAAIDGLESLILALACSGRFDVESLAFKDAVEEALSAIENHFD